MANFDANSWYQLYSSGGKSQSLTGSPLYDHGKGAVFFQNTNTTKNEQQWQMFPYNSSYYVMRTKGSGPIGYMNVAVSPDADTPGNTVAVMRNYTLSDASMFWTVGPWEDGTFFLANAANGSSWHLNVKPDDLMSMSSNITAPQRGQRFVFVQLGQINDTRFSSVATPTVTNPPTGVPTNPPADTTTTSDPGITPTSTSTPSSNSGLSTGAQAGIGASVGGVGLILLILGAFFLYRRRKRARAAPAAELNTASAYEEEQKKNMLPHEMHATEDPRHELDVPPSELGDGNNRRSELGSENYGG